MKITKIKNFEGYVNHCNCCGSEIKHAFKIAGSSKVYGSQCIFKIAGVNISNAKKQIKQQMVLAKRWEEITSIRSAYNLQFYIDQYGSIEKVEEIFFKYGKLR